MKSKGRPGLGLVEAVVVLAALLLLTKCAPAAEPEAVASTLVVQRSTATNPPPVTLAVTRTAPRTPSSEQAQVTITLSQPTYYTTETVVFTVANRLDEPIYVSEADCFYSGLRRIEGDDVIPLIVYYFDPDPADLFKQQIGPGESLDCGWRQEVFQDPSADGAARFLNANPANGRRLPVPPGEYQVEVSYYMSKEEVGQESKAQVLVSPRFTIVPAPFREQLVITLKSEYRLGEPIGYTIRNVGKPREWRGPIYLRGSGCGTAIVERLDGSGAVQQWSAADERRRNRMEPGHTRLCTLDPQLRIAAASDGAPLEPGTYRIGLTYELDGAIAGTGEGVHQVLSVPFTVTNEPLPAVSVTVGKLQYGLGEPVDLTISNSSEAPIYTYENCGEPPIWWVNGNWINRLVMRITEEWIPARPLAPGESWSCTWQQESYDTLPQGADRFGSDRDFAVPPGTYQLRLIYFLTDPEEDPRPAGERDRGLTAVSRPFVIGEP